MSPRRSTRRILLLTLLLGACAVAPPPQTPAPVGNLPLVGLFSADTPGEEMPKGWEAWTFSRFKKPTQYRLVKDAGRTVLHAKAHGSASGLIYRVRVDLKKHPYLTWRWKVPELIDEADNTKKNKEDSPVRMVIAFNGNRENLSFDDTIFAQQFRLFTQRELPYATLMYIWENRLPESTVIPNPHTGRIKMIVAETGSQRLGRWYTETRNVYEDYKRAYGEEPAEVQWVAIMTDTDNTGDVVDAFYGDIAFLAEAVPTVE